MTTLPTGAELLAASDVAAMKGLMNDFAGAVSEMPGGSVATTITIAAGQITPTMACHLVDTESASAADDLTNILTTNHPDGRRLLLSMVDAARVVTIKHNAGGAGQVSLVNGYDLALKVGGWVELKRTGTGWQEVSRSQNLISTVRMSGPIDESYATVASAATTSDIWSAKGNVINFTGTATVTAFPAAPQAGIRRRLICAGACSFTNGANFVVDGGSFSAVAGDVIDVDAVTTTSFKLHPIPVNPGATTSRAGLVEKSTSAENIAGTSDTVFPSVAGVKEIIDTQTPTIRSVPQNSQSAAYTLALSDAGKHIYHPSSDTTARTWTIPSNASVAFPIGTGITMVNDNSGGAITIAITSDTLRWSPSGATGSRTLAANGVATILKVTSTSWVITGTGLS